MTLPTKKTDLKFTNLEIRPKYVLYLVQILLTNIVVKDI